MKFVDCLQKNFRRKYKGEKQYNEKIIEFNSETLSKQLISACADLDDSASKDRIVKSVTVSINYDYNENTALFDNIQLSLDDAGDRCSYDENRNIKSILDSSNNQTLIKTTDHNEIESITSPKNYTSTVEYSTVNHHIPVKSIIPLPDGKLMISYEYDKFHNVIKTTASSNDESGKIVEQNYAYTSDGNYLKSATNVFGNTIKYEYNKKNGNLESVTDAKGNIIEYEYDRVGRLIKAKNKSSEPKDRDTEPKITYKNGMISSISHNNDEKNCVVYNFDYDNFGKLEKTSVGAQTLSENTYDAHNGLLKKSTYGNGDEVQFDYDQYQRLIRKTCTKSQGESKEYTYSYNSNGIPFAINDKSRAETVNFEYDTSDRLVKKAYSTGTEIEYKYDEDNILKERSTKSTVVSFDTTVDFEQQGRLINSKTYFNEFTINRDLWYDNICRLEGVSSIQIEPNQGGVQSKFTYVDVSDTNKTSALIKSVAYQKSTNNDFDTWEDLEISYSYEYDANCNITKIFENSVEKVSYEYDAHNQLIRENNTLIGKTIAYEYDFGGHILSKKEYAYSTEDLGEILNEITYDYSDKNRKDKLTSFNGETFTYDKIGNPLTYRDGITMTWAQGYKLEQISKSGLDISFEYGFDGIRRKKTVNGKVTEFITGGIKVIAEKTEDRVLAFLTDGNGNTYGFVLNEVPHFYLKNIQGDIVGITDAAGNIEARYTYDSWGKLVSITDLEGNDVTDDSEHIGFLNPLRYRGYYYDQETGLYYLNARYYDPQTGRFINADSNLQGGLNLFAYCFNNPIGFADHNGKIPDPVEWMICIGSSIHYPRDMSTPLPARCSYNCWGWVLNKITGKFVNDNPLGYDRPNCTMDNLTTWTIQELEHLGAKGQALGELDDNALNSVTSTLLPNQYLVAMRADGNGAYHYMRYDNDSWTFKQYEGGMLCELVGITPNDDLAWSCYIANPFNGEVYWSTNNGTQEPVRYLPYKCKTRYIKVTLPLPREDSCCLIN